MLQPATDLIVHSEQPLNAETPADRLCAGAITAQADLYVRNHGELPRLDASTHRVRVTGLVDTPLDLSVDDLAARFPQRSVVAALQCAGNRRSHLAEVRPAAGNQWHVGAIGNALWSGVALADVLQAAGARHGPGLHVELAGCDPCEAEGERFLFTVSIPMEKATAPEVLLATAINGEPLTPAHGFPLRAIVPGFVGARSTKWLTTITVRDEPSTVRSQARDYKLFPPDVRAETADWSKGIVIDEMPLNSAICQPAPGSSLAAGPTTVRGYALHGRGDVARVEVSSDGGQTWVEATLEQDPASPWAWTLWTATIDLDRGEHVLTVRAWTGAGQTQPERPEDTWNFKGYVNTAWHRVPVRAA